MPSYVVISDDPADLAVKLGPITWDGQVALNLPPGVHMMLTAAAQAAGYTLPQTPVSITNVVALQTKAQTAIALNVAYLATASPNAAQVAAQVRRLTMECTALIRLLLAQSDATDGT